MLAGHPPFTGTTAHELLARHATDPVPPLRTGRATIPEPIEEAVEKALAKVPADRYATTQLFSDALQIDTAAYRKRQRTIKTVWRLLVAGVAGTAIVAAAYGAVVGRGPLRGLFAGGSAKVADPAWVLVADFEGPPEDPGLATAVRELASSAVEQSRWLTTVPSGDVTRARRLAEIPDTALLTLESARHLAYRTSVEMVLAGRVDRIQSSAYAVVVRMVATDDGRVLGSLTIETDDAHIVRDIVRLTADMLNRLPRHGEQRPRWTPSTLRTNSFEAFRLALDASQRNTVNDYAGAVDLAKRAVALDSGFADAWLNLGVYYTNLGWPDSARAAFEQARRHSSRLAPERTWFLTAMTATRTLDRIRAYEARVQQDPKAAGAYNNLGLFLQDLGRFDEARESFERGIAVSPFGPSPLILENYAALLAASGHGDSALAVIPTPQIQLHAAVGTGRWVVAESLASRVLGDPAGIARYRARGALVLASVEAVRGRVRSALEHFESVGTFDPNLSDWAKVLVAAATGTEPPAMPPVAGDTSVRALIKAGIASALAGSRGEAVRFQQMVRTRGLNDGYAEWRDARLLDAMIAAQEGHWRRAVELVSRIANEGGGAFGATPPLARWLTATAYRQLGQRDSAIAYLEPLVFPRRMAWWNLQYSGFVHSFALQRLVVLNAELGRVEDARRYWVLLRDTFTDPDPEYAHLISDAKAALEVAERAKG
jgi:tetratricopeptide (TPR) repeat protein